MEEGIAPQSVLFSSFIFCFFGAHLALREEHKQQTTIQVLGRPSKLHGLNVQHQLFRFLQMGPDLYLSDSSLSFPDWHNFIAWGQVVHNMELCRSTRNQAAFAAMSLISSKRATSSAGHMYPCMTYSRFQCAWTLMLCSS